jgi:hypothetical protein
MLANSVALGKFAMRSHLNCSKRVVLYVQYVHTAGLSYLVWPAELSSGGSGEAGRSLSRQSIESSAPVVIEGSFVMELQSGQVAGPFPDG